jgi:hypothetical protein
VNNFAFFTIVSSWTFGIEGWAIPTLPPFLTHFLDFTFYVLIIARHPRFVRCAKRATMFDFPFTNSRTFTYFMFQIIHCDLCMSPFESVIGFKYYLIMIHDHSNNTKNFPLRIKFDAPSILTTPRISLVIQSCNMIMVVNSTILISNHSSSKCVSPSCLHTSPQNGKLERNIHTINDIMCVLLFQAHLKTSYWVEALHTTTYLFNRHPSHPLHLITPYETLFLECHDCSHLCAFICLCFPNLSATSPNKLSPGSIACNFI